ncbi:MAG: glycosyl hydrolase-related protein [Clostridia bacterium]|nr:glycosyl hydrolase-related protein [Clostridia bacterium]
MALNLEWKNRIELFKESLKNVVYVELGELHWEGALTYDLLTLQGAEKLTYKPFNKGEKWGEKWQYCWFKTNFAVPQEAEGKRLVVKLDVGGESSVYVNKMPAGAIDWAHKEICLSKSAKAGEIFSITVEAYAGHGVLNCGGGPVPFGTLTVPEVSGFQAEIGKSTYGIWLEDVYQLYMDLQVLYQIRNNIDPDSLRVAKIDEALKKVTLILDIEEPQEAMLASVKKCRELLKPLMECKNGSTTPLMYVFGHSHIDVAWLWPLAETEKKCTRTFPTQLSLMEEYPRFKFLQSQAYLYSVVKNKYKELYEKIKEAVKKGVFIPDGAMWVEPDTNLAGGESLIRQFIHGKRFFKEEFNADSRLCWLPDVFGYSGALPQIMKGCEVDYFTTQKLLWAYNGGVTFPYNTFWWEGIDGTRILSHIYYDYNAVPSAEALIRRWKERNQKDGISTFLFPFGHGDGGGGPERDHLEYLERCKDIEGVPKTVMTNPVDFFKDMEASGEMPDEVYVGELYFQCHRGTYTSQARTKKLMRRCEFYLREAEFWSSIAYIKNSCYYDSKAFDELWKCLLKNQFHDILPGSSIHRVYEEAEKELLSVLDSARELSEKAQKNLIASAKGISVFNSLSWESKKLVKLPEGFEGAEYKDGTVVKTQKEDESVLAEVLVPPCGFVTIYPSEKAAFEKMVKSEENILENNILRIKLNKLGEIESIFDKEADREICRSACNVFAMYKDVPNAFDAWDIDSMYVKMPVKLEDEAIIEHSAEGAIYGKVKIKRKLNNSFMEQEIILWSNSRRIDFKTAIEWNENHKLLKVCFPVNVYSNEAKHEIQFGYVKRPNHYSQEFDKQRFEVCNHKWTALHDENYGVAILNDCKYGVNVYENSINLTLLKAALAPDMTADKGKHEFTYSFLAWNGCFAESNVIREGYELNAPTGVIHGEAGCCNLFSTDKNNIIIETVKLAEDGTGDVIIRCYEALKMQTKCNLNFEFNCKQAFETNMIETNGKQLPINGNSIALDFRPFEIKTLRLIIN